jgi:coproporphyrinogen III oxidase
MSGIGIFKDRESEEESDNSFEIVIPETKGILDGLAQAIRQEHQQESEENEKQGKPQKQRRGGTICFCGVEHCRIGPFVEKA